MEKLETQFQLWPQVHLHVVTVARVDIKDGQMKEVNEKALSSDSMLDLGHLHIMSKDLEDFPDIKSPDGEKSYKFYKSFKIFFLSTCNDHVINHIMPCGATVTWKFVVIYGNSFPNKCPDRAYYF